ncbi:MAG: S1/P1 nuclease [Bacteroidota bacterium]
MKRLAGIILLLTVLVQSGFGWGATGHRATGWIAEQHLNAKAKKKLKALLKGESLAMITTWMDEVRSDSTYDYMSDWHWVTVETGQTYDQSKKNPNGDVIMTLERVIAELKSGKLSGQKEVEAIKILAHLVGDIHQPLHVGCCDDQGGNRVRVKWFRGDSNLHRVWDSDMIDDTKLSYTELAQSLGTPDKATVKKWQSASVREWATESMSYRPQVYAVGDGNLGYKYAYKNLPTAKERMLQAGVRLAGVLNAIYG